ncbi:MAG: DUF1566 domain-containing protein [Bacteroidales bacterium]|nr:DUF1566 domain-containing protein [Bacteroidales bacterium]
MKQVKYITMLLAALLFGTTINAQGIKIYQKSGEVIEIAYTDIDSIVAYGDNSYDDMYEAVDLGLSVKWAASNVGTTIPEDYGEFYSWGEIESKSVYSPDNCATWGLSIGDISGNPEYDAATAFMEGNWRMPTKAEFQELLDSCTWTWTMLNEINGYKVTSKKNGNSIFLPAAGWHSMSSYNAAGIQGGYWCSTSNDGDNYSAYDIYFTQSKYGIASDVRFNGRNIRAVRK